MCCHPPLPAPHTATSPRTRQVLKDYQLPGPAYGCHWCPFNKHMLVTGCQDGLVRVFDVSQVCNSVLAG